SRNRVPSKSQAAIFMRFLLPNLYSRTQSRATPETGTSTGAPPLEPRQRRCLCTPQGASRPLTRQRVCFGGKPPKQTLSGVMEATGTSLLYTAQRNFFKRLYHGKWLMLFSLKLQRNK